MKVTWIPRKEYANYAWIPTGNSFTKTILFPPPLDEKSALPPLNIPCTTTPVGEVPSHHAIRVDFDYTIHESKIAKYKRKGICIPGNLADECSHCLVFEERTTLLHFKNVFTQIFKLASSQLETL
jgi:hypothetical protein